MDGGDRSAPLASPVFATLADLPPLLIQVGSHEVLLDDAVRLTANAGGDDVDVTLQVAPEGTHVFQLYFGALDEADEALDEVARSSGGTSGSSNVCVAPCARIHKALPRKRGTSVSMWARRPWAAPPGAKLASTLPEERVKISWVTIDRICQEEADDKEDVRRQLERTGKPLRSSADPLSDDELLTKLRDLGVDVDRDGLERLCAGALSAEEVASPIVDKLELDDMTVDWVWICLLALWQRWWPDRACLELLDDKMQAGYALDPGGNTHAVAVTWLNAWSDVLRLCDATGIGSIEEFDGRFPLTQSLFNWVQDLEMALENAGRDNGEMRQALIGFCEESLRRFPREEQLMIENRRRALAGAYFDAGLTEKAEGLFGSWLDADPGWGWGWISWADCYNPLEDKPKDLGRAEKILRRGYRVPGVRDRADIADRLQEACEDNGRPDEARQFGEQARRLRREPSRPPASSAPSLRDSARAVKVGRNALCPCGSGKKFKKCCGSPLVR